MSEQPEASVRFYTFGIYLLSLAILNTKYSYQSFLRKVFTPLLDWSIVVQLFTCFILNVEIVYRSHLWIVCYK